MEGVTINNPLCKTRLTKSSLLQLIFFLFFPKKGHHCDAMSPCSPSPLSIRRVVRPKSGSLKCTTQASRHLCLRTLWPIAPAPALLGYSTPLLRMRRTAASGARYPNERDGSSCRACMARPAPIYCVPATHAEGCDRAHRSGHGQCSLESKREPRTSRTLTRHACSAECGRDRGIVYRVVYFWLHVWLFWRSVPVYVKLLRSFRK